jgi:hypothetical protein
MTELLREGDPECLRRRFSCVRRDIRGQVYEFARGLQSTGVSDGEIGRMTAAYLATLAIQMENDK